MAAVAAAGNPSKPQRPGIGSGAFDAFWLQCGLWLIPLAVGASISESFQVWALAVLSLAFWFAHRIASLFTIVANPHYATLFARRRHLLITVPLVGSAIIFTFMLLPESVVQLSTRMRGAMLATLFFALQHHHGAMQHFGVLSIYAARSSSSPKMAARTVERLFCFGVGALFVAIAQLTRGAKVVSGTYLHNAPGFLSQAAPTIFAATLVVAITLTMALFVENQRRGCLTWSRALYILGTFLQVPLAFILKPEAFLILWLGQHWLVAVGLSTRISLNAPRVLHSVIKSRLALGLWIPLFILIASSTIVGVVLRYEDVVPAMPRLLGGYSTLLQYPLVLPAILAATHSLFLGHMFWDRMLYRFSDPETRALTGGFLIPRAEVSEPAGGRQPAASTSRSRSAAA